MPFEFEDFDDFSQKMTAAETDRDLAKKFKNFGNHIDIYEAVVSAYLAVARALSSKETCTAPIDNIYSEDLRVWMQAVGGSANLFTHYIDVQKNYIETRLSFPQITMNLNYQLPDRLAAGEKIIRNFFPAFQTPRTFEKIKDSVQISPFFKLGEDVIEFSSVEKLSRTKADFTPGLSVEDMETGFKLPKGFHDKGFNGIAYLNLRLNLEGVQLRNNENPYSSRDLPDRGNLLEGAYTAYPVFNADAVFRWPMEFARWVTCTDEKDEFIPFMFFQYMNSHRSAYLAKRTRGGGYTVKTPARVNHLGKIVQMMGEERKQGRIVKIRVNQEGFLLLGTGEPSAIGRPLWVPNVNNVNEYMNQIKSCYDSSEKKLDVSKFKLSGVPILTDPNNEKFTYVREKGATGGASDISGLITFSLTGSVPLDRTTIYRYLSTKLSDPTRQDNLEEFFGGLHTYSTGKWGGEGVGALFSDKNLKQIGFDALDIRKGNELLLEIADFFLATPNIDVQFKHFHKSNLFKTSTFINNDPIEENSDAEKNTTEGIRLQIRRARAYLNLTFAVAQNMLRDFDALKIGFARKVEFWRFYLFLVCNYSQDAKDMALDYQDKLDLNSARPYMPNEVLKPSGLLIPNMPGLKKALPHQVECFLDFNMDPEMVMLEADVGGGKGMMGPVQALMYLQKGLIRRPLFLVPGRLVSNWANEIGKYTQGQVNPFPLTLPIVRRLQRVYLGEKGQSVKPDYDFLKKIIDACPINTFFISSFNFLVSDSDIITYANTEAARYYAAEFFRDLGVFDLVCMDETQKVKNLTTRATIASSVISSPAKYKTEMSGTFVDNVLTDLVGQAAIGNPAALGSPNQFVHRYAARYTGRGGQLQVQEWRPDAASMIISDMKAYTKRVIKKKDRWAFFLPKTSELFHPTVLTPNQQSFYNFQLDKKLEEIKQKNPALYQKMMDGNEKDQKAIAIGLDKSFQGLEAFLGAPDSDPDFIKIKGLSEDDLISAKLKKTVELLDKHFSGYTDDEGTTVAPSQQKVIIFSSRIPTVQHFERRMPERYKKMMATYYAGDEQSLEAFKTLPGIKIFLAAELSINMGQNLQIASRMIRLEALWGPGGQIQAGGRVERPDFENFDREDINLDWIVVNKTLDVAKTARLISKAVEKMKYDRQEEKTFTIDAYTPSPFMLREFGAALPKMREKNTSIEKMFRTLPLIKMNFDTFLKVNDIRQLDPYFASYALMQDYLQQRYNEERKNGLHTLIEITDDMRGTIKGSKRIDFMPRVPNVDPKNFDHNNEWGYKPISRLQMEIDLKKIDTGDEDEDDEDVFNEDNAAYEDVEAVNERDIVDTEFGIGRVIKILKNEIWVDIPGFRKVRVLKACAWLITNDKKLQEIKVALNRGQTFVKKPPGLEDIVPDAPEPVFDETETETIEPVFEVPAKPVPPRPTESIVVPEDADDTEKDAFEKETDEENAPEIDGIHIYAHAIDGQPALRFQADEGSESEKLINDFDFLHFASFWAVQIKTPKALSQVMAVLTKKFQVDPKSIADINAYQPLLQNKGQLETIQPGNLRTVTQFFARTMRKRLQKGQLRPYPIAWGKNFYIAIDQMSTPSYLQALQAIKNAAIPNVKILKQRQDDVHVRFVKNAADGMRLLKAINQEVSVANYKEVVEMLGKMRSRPVVRSVRDIAPVKTTTPVRPRPVVRSVRGPK